MDGILFSKLDEIVQNPACISKNFVDDRWGIMPYETASVQGNALVTTEAGHPEDVCLAPGLKGWHKIYVATVGLQGGFAFLLKMDDEENFTYFNSDWQTPTPSAWEQSEQIREFYWCCADLTGKNILLRKHSRCDIVTPLVWIRCVPMTEDEISRYSAFASSNTERNLHVHYDNAFDYYYGTDTEENLVLGYTSLKTSHAKICSQEILNDVFDEECASEKCRGLFTRRIRHGAVVDREIAAKMDWIVKTRSEYLHSIGVKMYAAFRMSMANVTTPFQPATMYTFVSEHPEYYIKTRDGRTCTICSYAYPETRRFVIEYLKRAVGRGYDGVSLIFHRGMHLGFEQPVLDEFARRNGGLDARVVPMRDARLQDVWCEYMTQFVRELRDELDSAFRRHIPINVITGQSPEISRSVGIDIEALCKEGLIDHFCAETMSTYENLAGCLTSDGLIDMDKYQKQLGTRYVVLRNYGEDKTSVEEGTPLFSAISEKYGVEFFAGMSPASRRAGQFVDWISMQKSLGAKNISFFNYLQYAKSPEITHAVTMTNHDSIDRDFYTPRFYRVLSLDGFDISTYPQNWRC